MSQATANEDESQDSILTTRVTESRKREVRVAAARRDQSISDFLRDLIDDELD